MKLKDKVALVTGAGGGIGQAIALRLATEGADVVINDIRLEPAQSVVDEIQAMGQKSLAVAADVSRSEDVHRMFEQILEQFGRIDILINNAGGAARERSAPFDQLNEEVWNDVVGSNLNGTMLCSRAALRSMIKQQSGKIINIASISPWLAGYSGVDYAAAKSGVITMTRTIAKGVGEHGITVNCISPGAIDTPGVMRNQQIRDNFLKSVCLKRLGRPDEIANMAAFLVSNEADFITGQNFIIDGGRSLGVKTE